MYKTKVIIILIFVSIFIIFAWSVKVIYRDNNFIFEKKVNVKTKSLNNLGNLNLYEYYRMLDRPYSDDYSLYVLNPCDDVYLLERYNNLSMDEVISSCRGISYKSEIGNAEYPKYPVETIVDNFGDCEDKSILCASILSLKGFNVSLVRFESHMMVLVDDILIETTGVNNKYSLKDAICVYPIISHSIFVLDWSSTIYSFKDNYYVSFNISIFNYGDVDDETILCISDNVSCYNFSFWVDAFTVKLIELNIEVLSRNINCKLNVKALGK